MIPVVVFSPKPILGCFDLSNDQRQPHRAATSVEAHPAASVIAITYRPADAV
jgi:hypothetical protein